MIVIHAQGRHGNLLLMNCVASLLAERLDLSAAYVNPSDYAPLRPLWHQGGRSLPVQTVVTDENLMHHLSLASVSHGLRLRGFFQIRDFVRTYAGRIRALFDLPAAPAATDEVFVHVRLGDVPEHNPGQDYYARALRRLQPSGGHIASDSPQDPMVLRLAEEFGLKPCLLSPVETLLFGSRFSRLVLSRGTFSWWLGVLSRAVTVIYPPERAAWHGDIFVHDHWLQLDDDAENRCIAEAA